MLQRRDSVPHFVVTTVEGREVRYADIWQRRFLVLVSAVPHAQGDVDGQAGGAADALRAYAADLVAACAATAVETACVVTMTAVEGVPQPGALVADRYGEIAFISGRGEGEALPAPEELADWLRYIGIRCS